MKQESRYIIHPNMPVEIPHSEFAESEDGDRIYERVIKGDTNKTELMELLTAHGTNVDPSYRDIQSYRG
jgi:hypothetical protein